MRFTYDVSGSLEVELRRSWSEQVETRIFRNDSNLTDVEIGARFLALGEVKLAPRDQVANHALIARAERQYTELLGARRHELMMLLDRTDPPEPLRKPSTAPATGRDDPNPASPLIEFAANLKALTTPAPTWDAAAWGSLLRDVESVGSDARATARTMVIKALVPNLPVPDQIAAIPKSFDAILQVVQQIETSLGLAANRPALLAASDRAAAARYGDWVRLCERSRAFGQPDIEAGNRRETGVARFAPEDLRSALPYTILMITLQAVYAEGDPEPANRRLRRLLSFRSKLRLAARLIVRPGGYGAFAGLPRLAAINVAAFVIADERGRDSYGTLFGSAGILLLARCLSLLGIAWLAAPLALRRVQRLNAARVVNPVERNRRLRPRVPLLLGRALNLVDFGSLLLLADALIEGIVRAA